MAKRRVRVTGVQRDQVDIDMLVSGLLLLLEELTQDNESERRTGTSPGESDR